MEKVVDKNQTIDETKRKLQTSREKLEGELEFQLQDIKRDAAEVGKQIAIVGGGLFLGWKLVKALTKSKKKDKDKRRDKRKNSSSNENNGPGFGSMLMHQLITLAVAAITTQVKDAFNQNNSVNDNKKRS